MSCSLSELVLEGWTRNAHRNAVVYDDGDKTCSLMYSELMEIANQLKTVLNQRVRRGEIVGLCLGEDETMVTTPAVLLGVLLAGAAFYNMAEESLEFSANVIREVQASIIIVNKHIFEKLQHIFSRDEVQSSNVLPPPLESLVLADLCWGQSSLYDLDLAYCITTSGTTGRPKIVKVPHRCIVPNIRHLRSIFDISCEDVTFAASPLTFDPSVVEIFVTLSAGACLLVIPSRLKMSPKTLLDIIWKRNRVTIVQATPTLLRRFDPAELSKTLFGDSESVRVMALGGEQFPVCSEIRGLRAAGNQTKFYNLYGTTEVSCWATYHHVTEAQLNLAVEEIPLGKPLEGTVLEVRDKAGDVVSLGCGFLFIGGTDRQCLLDQDEESTYNPGCLIMRATGDRVRVDKDQQLFYLGRQDAQVKIHGRRVNMEEINRVTRSHTMVVDCAALVISRRITLFIVLQPVGHGFYDVKHLREHLVGKLPNYSSPEDIILIQEMPMTKHGKVDGRALTKICKTRLQTATNKNSDKLLEAAWMETFGQTSSRISDDVNFIQEGGNSLKAVHLLNILEQTTNAKFPDLIDILLHKSFGKVKNYITHCIEDSHLSAKKVKLSGEDEFLGKNGNKGVLKEDNEKQLQKHQKHRIRNVEVIDTHDVKTALTECTRVADTMIDADKAVCSNNVLESSSKSYGFVLSISRGNRLTPILPLSDEDASFMALDDSNILESSLDSKEKVKDTVTSSNILESKFGRKEEVEVFATSSTDAPLTGVVAGAITVRKVPTIGLEETWRYNTGKCIDASPLVAVNSAGDGIVFIGSHSHKFCALCMETGDVKWKKTLPDRVESSACLSRCGNFVIVGCYDGSVYILSAVTGDIWWAVPTWSEVKSSPTVDLVSGLVYIGSHSQKLYGLNIKDRIVVWCQEVGCGSIFSSPVIGYSPHAVYAATLGGAVVAMETTTGEERWRFMCPKPVFGSPAITPQGICVSCTDGRLYLLDHRGRQLWTLQTSGPIFSSPCFGNVKTGLPSLIQRLVSKTQRHMDHASEETHAEFMSRKSWEVLSSEKDETFYKNKVVSTHEKVPEHDKGRFYETVHGREANRAIDREGVICVGSHDCSVYCVSQDGRIVWKTTLNSPVYATPFQAVLPHRLESGSKRNTLLAMRGETEVDLDDCCINITEPDVEGEHVKSHTLEYSGNDETTFRNKFIEPAEPSTSEEGATERGCCSDSVDQMLPVVVAASTRGTLYVMDSDNGAVMCEKQLDGEVFSSPVVFQDKIYVGCRDDFVYCFTINVA